MLSWTTTMRESISCKQLPIIPFSQYNNKMVGYYFIHRGLMMGLFTQYRNAGMELDEQDQDIRIAIGKTKDQLTTS